MFQLIKELTEIPGMAGREEAVQEYLIRKWKPHCSEIRKTGVGNVIAKIGGQGPKLLIESHADEIGCIVKGFSGEGMIWVAPKNSLAGRPGKDIHLLGQPCVIQTAGEPVEGIFATASGHNIPDDLREKNPIGWNDFFIDIGSRDLQETKAKGIQIGDTVVWNPPTRQLGHHIIGKAMDDRAGLAIMTKLLESIDPSSLPFELYFASTVMEEIGLIGAHSIGREIDFDYCIALDVGLSGDIPLVDSREVECCLGGGPTIVHHDGAVHYDTFLTRHIIRTAGKADIPIQHGVFTHYASDGHAMILSGVPSALIAFPARYTHSPYEMIDESDVSACVDLLKILIQTPLKKEIGGTV